MVNKCCQVFAKVAGQNFQNFSKLQLKCITTPRHEYENFCSKFFWKIQISVYTNFMLWKILKDSQKRKQVLLKNS